MLRLPRMYRLVMAMVVLLATSLAAMPIYLGLAAGSAAAETAYPTKPVKIIVPSAAGGGIDLVGRVIGDHLARALGQQFWIENRPGAGNMIGMDAVAKAAPDGYTLLSAASPLTINHLTYANIPYDARRDFAPISLIVSVPNVLVVDPRLPIKSLGELIATARAKPGELTYASAGLGTNPHMAMELLKSMGQFDLRHVPYRGVGPALVDVVAGNVSTMISTLLPAVPQVAAGHVRALAVTGRAPVAGLPGVPTVAASGLPGYETEQWYGMLAPAGTPPEIVAMLHAAIVAGLATPQIREKLELEGGKVVGNTPAEFARFIVEDMAKWEGVAKAAGLKAQAVKPD